MNAMFKRLCFTICIILQILILVSCGGVSGGGSNNSNSSSNGGPSNNTPATPTVKMLMPINDSTGASLTQTIQLQFSESVTNVSTTTITLHKDKPTGSTINTSNILLGDDNTYTFSPQEGTYLESNTVYYVVVGNGITSKAKGIAVESTNFNFTTGKFANPTVSMLEPKNESVNVSTSTIIKLHFSEAVNNVNSTTVELHKGSIIGNVVSTSIESGSDNTYTFTPESYLDGAATYYVVVNNQITSVATGESLEPATFNFTTSEIFESPTATILAPANNSTTNVIYPDIVIHFSESVSNVNNSTVILHSNNESGNVVNISLTKTLSKNTYVFIPTESLVVGATYYVELSNKILSKNGSLPLIPTTFNFTVQDPNFVYIAAKNGISVCPIIDDNGNFAYCILTLSVKNAYKVAINPTHTYAYVIDKNDSSINACSINRADGTLTACSATGNALNGPTSLSFTQDGTHAYVTNYSANNILTCSVIESSLTGCHSTGDVVFAGPSSIGIDINNGLAYIADSLSNTFYACSVSSIDGSLTLCLPTGSGNYQSPMGIGLTKNYLYSTSSTGSIIRCHIDSTSGFLACDFDTSQTYLTLADVTASGHKIYIADGGNGNITVCHQNESGYLGDCSYPSFGNTGLSGITTFE